MKPDANGAAAHSSGALNRLISTLPRVFVPAFALMFFIFSVCFAVSALVRLQQWLSCFKALPDMTGRFAINNLLVTSTDITWNMDLADEKDWEALAAKFKALPGISTPPGSAAVSASAAPVAGE